MNTLDLSHFCRTKAEARDFASRLAGLSETVYRTDFHLETALTKTFGLRRKDTILTLMRESGAPLKTPSDLKNFFVALREQITSLPVLSLSLAFEPTEATLTILTDWFLINSNHHILFDITVDPTLIAGVAIRYNGRYVEYSVKPTVVNIIQETITNPKVQPAASKPNPVPHQAIESMSMGR